MARDKGGENDPENPSAPGWYPDPWSATGEGERYFDGEKWGSSERPLGRLTVVDLDQHRKQRGRRKKTESGSSPSRWRLPSHLRPVALLVALVLLIWGVPKLFHHDSNKRPTVTEPNVTEPTSPPASQEEAAQPIGRPATVPTGKGQYEVSLHQPNDPNVPVAFDPCRPIHYVVNMKGAPADGLSIIQTAIARVQSATGLHFVSDGTTDEFPDKERQAYQPKRYRPDRWAPVLIAWASEKEFAPLTGYIDGIGIADPVYSPGAPNRLVYVSGEVVLDREQLSPAQMPDRALARAAVLHELGHLVGLDHTSDRKQIMFSEGQFNVKDYGVGDLRGLAALGTQACYPSV